MILTLLVRFSRRECPLEPLCMLQSSWLKLCLGRLCRPIVNCVLCVELNRVCRYHRQQRVPFLALPGLVVSLVLLEPLHHGLGLLSRRGR